MRFSDLQYSGAKKTQIMYRAYLSVAQLNEYLRDLTEKQLIRYEEDSRIFRVTDRGIRFLSVYDEISELVTVSEERPFLKTSDTTSFSQKGRDHVEALGLENKMIRRIFPSNGLHYFGPDHVSHSFHSLYSFEGMSKMALSFTKTSTRSLLYVLLWFSRHKLLLHVLTIPCRWSLSRRLRCKSEGRFVCNQIS